MMCRIKTYLCSTMATYYLSGLRLRNIYREREINTERVTDVLLGISQDQWCCSSGYRHQRHHQQMYLNLRIIILNICSDSLVTEKLLAQRKTIALFYRIRL